MKKQEQFVVWSCGTKVEVNRKVFRFLMQDRWREEKRAERESRCKDEKGHRCALCCRTCPAFRSGKPLSLERMVSDGCEPAGMNDTLDLVLNHELYRALHKEIESLDSLNRQIVILFGEGLSETAIGKAVGLSQKAVNKRKHKIFAMLREKLQSYI